jgi:hypothetical protein
MNQNEEVQSKRKSNKERSVDEFDPTTAKYSDFFDPPEIDTDNTYGSNFSFY